MNVNDFFTQVGDFWRSISIPILFHLVFLTLYSYLFGPIPVKARLEQYIKSENFSRTKVILTEFELWTKLPYILLISLLVYLSVFNSIAEVAFSSLPLDFSYSNSNFFKEYQRPEDIIEIVKYGRVESPRLGDVDNLLTSFLEEYKAKYPERYKAAIDSWGQTEFSKRRILFSMSCLTILLLIAISPRYLRRQKIGLKLTILTRLLGLVLLAAPLIFFLRYNAEQAIEQQFVSKIYFVKSCLEMDSSKHVTYTEQQSILISNNINKEINEPLYYMPSIWISRIVSNNTYLEYILPRRTLRNTPIIRVQKINRHSPIKLRLLPDK